MSDPVQGGSGGGSPPVQRSGPSPAPMTREAAQAAVDALVDAHDGSPYSALVLLMAAAGQRLARSEGRDCAVKLELVIGRSSATFWADSFTPFR